MGHRYCSVEECIELVFCRGLCSTHFKRLQRGLRLDLQIRGSSQKARTAYHWERVVVAALALAYADSENDDDYSLKEQELKDVLASTPRHVLVGMSKG